MLLILGSKVLISFGWSKEMNLSYLLCNIVINVVVNLASHSAIQVILPSLLEKLSCDLRIFIVVKSLVFVSTYNKFLMNVFAVEINLVALCLVLLKEETCEIMYFLENRHIMLQEFRLH